MSKNQFHRPCSCGKPREKSWHLACPECWALVPKPLQDDVYHQYKTAQGSDTHVAAVRRCYEAIHAARAIQKSEIEPATIKPLMCRLGELVTEWTAEEARFKSLGNVEAECVMFAARERLKEVVCQFIADMKSADSSNSTAQQP